MIVIFDLELKELIPQSGDLSSCEISIAGLRAAGSDRFFTEERIPELLRELDAARLIVGFNIIGFDYRVLQNYADFDVRQRYCPKTYDIMYEIERSTGRLVGLNDVAQRTLGIAKSGSGKEAPLLYKQGRLQELERYLAQDLELTTRLFAHICSCGSIRYGHLIYKEPQEREARLRLPLME